MKPLTAGIAGIVAAALLGALTACHGHEAAASVRPAVVPVPSLGLLNGSGESDRLVWSYEDGRIQGCVYVGPSPAPGGSLPRRPEHCIDWTFLDADTGAQVLGTQRPVDAGAEREAVLGCTTAVDTVGPVHVFVDTISDHLGKAARLDGLSYGHLLTVWTAYRDLIEHKRIFNGPTDWQKQRAFFRACDDILGRQPA